MAEPTFDELKAHDLFCRVVDVVREGGDDALAWKPIAQALASARADGVKEGLEMAAALCDGQANLYRERSDGNPERAREMQKYFVTMTDASRRIRALKGTT